jgi:hypothetical protein
MTHKEAIELLKDHNSWIGLDGEKVDGMSMTDPDQLRIAIDIVVKEYENPIDSTDDDYPGFDLDDPIVKGEDDIPDAK